MFDQMKQLMEMKKQAGTIKKELAASIVEVSEARGIHIKINGSQTFQSIEIDESLLDPQRKNRFENDLLRSLNAAIQKSQKVAAQKMKAVMPGL